MFRKSWKKHCRIFHILAQFLLSINEREIHYYLQRVSIRVASQVAKQHKTKILGNHKISRESLKCLKKYPQGHPKRKVSQLCYTIEKN